MERSWNSDWIELKRSCSLAWWWCRRRYGCDCDTWKVMTSLQLWLSVGGDLYQSSSGYSGALNPTDYCPCPASAAAAAAFAALAALAVAAAALSWLHSLRYLATAQTRPA